MATQTLAQAALLINDEIVRGVAEDIITVNPIFNYVPFYGYEGQAIVVNRELTLGGVDVNGIGATITSTMKTASTFTQKTFSATRIIGDAEMDKLLQAQSASAGVDQLALEISLKAKNVGRKFQDGMATGTGLTNNLNGFVKLLDATQVTSSCTATAGRAISFTLLDELCDLVVAKDGVVDWICMPARTLRSLKALYRALGGTMPIDVLTMPDGTTRTVYKYEDIPVFVNGYLPTVEDLNAQNQTGGAFNSVWAGVWDDGTGKVGYAAIHPASVPAGIMVEHAGVYSDKDVDIWRVKQYVNFALFNRKGLARLTSINN